VRFKFDPKKKRQTAEESKALHWFRSGKQQRRSEDFMKKTPKPRNPISAESIAKRAERGQDVSRYFTNAGRMMPPVQRVNVDFAQDMLRELDLTARELNVSRQAVIKIFVRQALNQHYLAQRARHEKTSSKRA